MNEHVLSNPYAPPVSDRQPPTVAADQQSDRAPRGFAVASLVLGIVVAALCLLAIVAGQSFSQSAINAEVTTDVGSQLVLHSGVLSRSVQRIGAWLIRTGFAFLIAALLLIPMSIGQWRYRRWARAVTIIWCSVVGALFPLFIADGALSTDAPRLVGLVGLLLLAGFGPLLLSKLIWFSSRRARALMVR